jgi:hypothetical protein
MTTSRSFSTVLGGLVLVVAFAACSQPAQPAQPSASADVQAVASARSGLAIGFAVGDSASSVTGNLALPTAVVGDVTVGWASNNASVISISGGAATVTRPSTGQADARVVLTATLAKGEARDTKTFSLTVKAKVLAFAVSHDWTDFTTGVSSPVVYCVAKSGNSIYAGTQNEGLLYSDDLGASWSVKDVDNDKIPSDQVYSIAVSGDLVIFGTFNGFSVWDRSTSPGSITNYLPGKQISDIIVSGSTVYMAASDGLHACTTSAFTTTVYSTGFSHPSRLFIADGKLYATGDSDSTNTQELDVWVIAPSLPAFTMIDVVGGTASTVGPVFVDGQSLVVGVDSTLYRRGPIDTAFSSDYATGGGRITGLGHAGSYLLAVKYGGDLWYSSDSGLTWSSATIPGHAGLSGIFANGILCEGSTVFIAYSGGIVMGTLE